jgi:hypothetical protein
VLTDAGKAYGTTPYDVFTHESAMHAQRAIRVPLLNVYSQDDQLVKPLMAGLMASYEQGNPLQRTLLLDHGMHAYFYDRWWQQQAILDYFKSMLGAADPSIHTATTVNQTPGGAAFSSHLLDIPAQSPADADASLAPFVCDASMPAPGRPSPATHSDTTPAANPGSNPSPITTAVASPTLPNTSAAATGNAAPATAAIAVIGGVALRRRRRRRRG